MEGSFHGSSLNCMALSSECRRYGPIGQLLPKGDRKFAHVIPCPRPGAGKANAGDGKGSAGVRKRDAGGGKKDAGGGKGDAGCDKFGGVAAIDEDGKVSLLKVTRRKDDVYDNDDDEDAIPMSEETEENDAMTDAMTDEAGRHSVDALETILGRIHESGKRVAAFICEPFLTKSGMVTPPKKWLKVVVVVWLLLLLLMLIKIFLFSQISMMFSYQYSVVVGYSVDVFVVINVVVVVNIVVYVVPAPLL